MAMIKTQSLEFRATKAGPKAGEKALREPKLTSESCIDRSRIRIGDHAWVPGANYYSGNTYYGRDYVLNTKYVVDAEAHDTVGCLVTLTCGKGMHVDLHVDQVLREGNRR